MLLSTGNERITALPLGSVWRMNKLAIGLAMVTDETKGCPLFATPLANELIESAAEAIGLLSNTSMV